jgi:hypothetical protein
MNTYKHTQRGTVIILAMLAMSALIIAVGITVAKPVLIPMPLLLLAGWLFHSLTIEISERELRWRFGPGLIRKSVLLNEIASAEPVRTNFVEGWGIHMSRFGWLYNVSGHDAVAITLKSGKRFALGTDEPGVLANALKR